MLIPVKTDIPQTETPIPWNRLFREAKKGDDGAVRDFFAAAQPFIDRLCKNAFFRDRLGRDEIQSVAFLALARILQKLDALPEDSKVPYLLRRVLRFTLIDCVRTLDVLEEYEQPSVVFFTPMDPDGDGGTDDMAMDFPADDRDEPENRCLRQELGHEVRSAIERLSPREQAVIKAHFYDGKDIRTIAAELRCSPQHVRASKRNALTRLRRMLKRRVDA